MVQTNTLEKGLLAPSLRAVCLLPGSFKKGADLSRNGGIWVRSRHRRCPQEAQCGRDRLGPGAGRAEGIQDTSPEASRQAGEWIWEEEECGTRASLSQILGYGRRRGADG